MSKSIEVATALDIISSAFAPLRCVAKSFDYGYRIRFMIFDKDELVLNIDEIIKPQFCDYHRLNFIINEARLNLLNRGFCLTEWHFPKYLI